MKAFGILAAACISIPVMAQYSGSSTGQGTQRSGTDTYNYDPYNYSSSSNPRTYHTRGSDLYDDGTWTGFSSQDRYDQQGYSMEDRSGANQSQYDGDYDWQDQNQNQRYQRQAQGRSGYDLRNTSRQNQSQRYQTRGSDRDEWQSLYDSYGQTAASDLYPDYQRQSRTGMQSQRTSPPGYAQGRFNTSQDYFRTQGNDQDDWSSLYDSYGHTAASDLYPDYSRQSRGRNTSSDQIGSQRSTQRRYNTGTGQDYQYDRDYRDQTRQQYGQDRSRTYGQSRFQNQQNRNTGGYGQYEYDTQGRYETSRSGQMNRSGQTGYQDGNQSTRQYGQGQFNTYNDRDWDDTGTYYWNDDYRQDQARSGYRRGSETDFEPGWQSYRQESRYGDTAWQTDDSDGDWNMSGRDSALRDEYGDFRDWEQTGQAYGRSGQSVFGSDRYDDSEWQADDYGWGTTNQSQDYDTTWRNQNTRQGTSGTYQSGQHRQDGNQSTRQYGQSQRSQSSSGSNARLNSATGRITEIDRQNNRLVIQTDNGQRRTFRTDNVAVITSADQEDLRMQDLRRGQRVSIGFRNQDGRNAALSITELDSNRNR